jgi:ribulose-5-phosphate 4-epimerase/fuculose-1-phosphate aldolase
MAAQPIDVLCDEQLQAARSRLVAKGLLHPGDSVSIRVPGADACLFLVEPAGDAIDATRQPLSKVSAGAVETHRVIYAARPDVGAILLNGQQWAAGLPAAGGTLPGIFDEQLRQLGWEVRQIAPSALSDSRSRLASGANAFGLGSQVLSLGMTAERLVFNAELLEKCCKAYLLASAADMPVRKIPWLVRWVATSRLFKEQKRAAASFALGQMPARSAGYK